VPEVPSTPLRAAQVPAPLTLTVSSCRTLRVLVLAEARGLTGAVRNLLDVAGSARLRGSPVTWELATYRRAGEPDVEGGVLDCVRAARAMGLHTHVLDERRAGDPALIGRLRALVREIEPDIVETHHVKSHLLAALSGVPRGRWIAVHHGYTTTTARVRAANALDCWTLRRPALVVTPCEAFARQLRWRGVSRNRIAVVHNAVDPAPEDPALTRRLRAWLGVPPNGSIIVSIGRLSREKAQAVLIAALAQPHLAGSGRATVVLVGEGPERSRLERLAARLGVASRVRVLGYQPDPWPFIHAADVVALPSDSEGSPNALLEAMAAGKPVVATRVGGVPEIVEHGCTGVLVPPRSPVALSRALSDLLRAPDAAAALGRQAREVVRERFCVERRADTLTALYRQVVS
jgi:glycosyltransferase involved in cell wall biosynthesis